MTKISDFIDEHSFKSKYYKINSNNEVELVEGTCIDLKNAIDLSNLKALGELEKLINLESEHIDCVSKFDIRKRIENIKLKLGL